MRQFLLSCLLAAFSGCLFSQNFAERFYGRTASSDDHAGHAAAAADGGFFITGSTATTDSLYDIFLLKTDATGQQQWWRTFGGAADDAGAFVSATPDGGCVIGGRTDSEGQGRSDGFVKKIAPDGSLQWTALFGDSGADEVTCVRPTADGGYVLCGHFVNNWDDGQDVFIAALTPEGAVEMYETFGSPGLDRAYEVIEFATGGYLLHCFVPGYGPEEGDFMIKYSINGDVIWQNPLFDEFIQLGPVQLCAGPDGRIYFGNSRGRLDLSSFNSGLVACLRPNGTVEWATSLSSNSFQPFALQPLPSGELLVEAYRPFSADSSGLLFHSPNLRRYKLDAEGDILEEDSLNLSSGAFIIQQLLFGTGERPAVLYSGYFDANGQFDPGLLVSSGAFGQWDEDWFRQYGASSINGHEYLLDAVRIGSGDFFAAASRYDSTTASYDVWLLHTDAEGNPLHETTVPLGNPVSAYYPPRAQLDPTPDQGVMLFIDDVSPAGRSQVAQVTPNGGLVWRQTLPLQDSLNFSDLRALPDGGFAMLAYDRSGNGSNYRASRLARFDAGGNLQWLKQLHPGFDAEKQEYGEVNQFLASGEGFVLQGSLYNTAAQTHSLWMVFTDADGNMIRENLTEGYFYQNQTIRHTADGGFLLSGEGYISTPVSEYYPVVGWLKLDPSGHPEWDYRFTMETFDEDVTPILAVKSVEELPCDGYVFAVDARSDWSSLPGTYIAESQFTFLLHVDFEGKGKDIFVLPEFPEPIVSDSFLPGYVYREWGSRRNGLTQDLFFRRIVFENDTLATGPDILTLEPNPSADRICLSLRSDFAGPVGVRIFDAGGRLLDAFEGHKHEPVWTYPYYAKWPAGTYFVRVEAGETRKTLKWIKH